MGPSPQLTCGGVELRLITPRAAHQLFALAREPEVSAMLQWPAHRSIDDSLAYVHDALSLWERRLAWLPGIFDRERDQLVGCTGVHAIDRANARAEVGTWIGLPFQGRGFNRPAKAALATAAFELLDLRRLELLVRTDNERSLAATRALPGVREEGVLRDRLVQDGAAHDAVSFALLRSDWDPAAWPTVDVVRGVGASPDPGRPRR